MPSPISCSTLRGLLGAIDVTLAPPELAAAQVGLVLPALVSDSSRLARTLGWYVDLVLRAAAQDQLELLFDCYGRLCGHVIWTRVEPALELALRAGDPGTLEVAQCSRQGSAWVLFMGASFGSLPSVLIHLRDCFIDDSKLGYFRHRGGTYVVRTLSRSSAGWLLRQPPGATNADATALLLHPLGAGLLAGARAQLHEAIKLGHCLKLMASVPDHSSRTLQRALQRLRIPLGLRQCRLYLSPQTLPIGLISWAWLDAARQANEGYGPPEEMPTSEWNEGTTLQIVDIVSTPEASDAIEDKLARLQACSECDPWR